MTVSRCLLVLSAIALLGAVVTPVRAAQDKPLNLLIITADDMNADTPGWMGDKLKVTPNLDKFAATAHQFVNAHVTVPICMPCRSAFMTGLVPHRNGALGFNPIKPGTPTLTTILQAEGYYAAVIEKHVHMKPDSEFPWDLKLSGGGKNPAVMRENMEQAIKAAADAGKPFFLNANITDPHRPFPNAAPKRPAPANPKKEEAGDTAKPAGKKAGKAAAPAAKDADADDSDSDAEAKPGNKRAAKNAGVAQPSKTYTPEQMTVPAFLEDVPELRRELAQYYTAVGRLDETFEQIMAVLKETGHVDDTIVVFFSDHGISMPFAKATAYYNGTWSPVLIRWPGMGEPQVRKELVSSVDLLPTVLGLLKVDLPKEHDGVSWLPLLKGESQPGRDHVVTHVNTVSSGKDFTQRCVRTKDAALIFMGWSDGKTQFRVEGMSGLAFKAMSDAAESDPAIADRVKQLLEGRQLAYYELKSDPGERDNLIDDTSRRPEIQRLAKLMIEHMERTNDPKLADFKKAMAEQFDK